MAKRAKEILSLWMTKNTSGDLYNVKDDNINIFAPMLFFVNYYPYLGWDWCDKIIPLNWNWDFVDVSNEMA